MENLAVKELEKLPRETLIEIIRMHSRNWMTLDGLWFSGVEEAFGVEAAMELDIRMWRKGSRTEARRIKQLLDLGPGLDNVIRAIHFMSWAASFGYRVEESEGRALWTCTRCPPQENRLKAGLAEFPCRPTFEACFVNVCEVIDPSIQVTCICPGRCTWTSRSMVNRSRRESCLPVRPVPLIQEGYSCGIPATKRPVSSLAGPTMSLASVSVAAVLVPRVAWIFKQLEI